MRLNLCVSKRLILFLILICVGVAVASLAIVGMTKLAGTRAEWFTRPYVPEVLKPPPPVPPREEAVSLTAEVAGLSRLDVYGRMIIYTAGLSLEVESLEDALNAVRYVADKYGGFIASISATSGKRRLGVVTLRVPQESFYEAMEGLKKLGEVKSEEVRSEDVTERYIDLKARLNNLKKQEARLLEILDMCTTVEEVLKVEAELNRVRSEIERLTGQLQYLERRVELATITVTLTEKEAEKPWIKPPEIDWGKPVESGLWALATIAQLAVTATIVLTPFAIIVGAPAYLYYKRGRIGKSEKQR